MPTPPLLLAWLACSGDTPAPAEPTAGVDRIALAYTAHVGGEIEPCG